MAEKSSDRQVSGPPAAAIELLKTHLEPYRFDPTKKITKPLTTLSLSTNVNKVRRDVPMCTSGNISNFQGQAKSAKSSALGAAMAAILRALTGKKEDLVETLGFTCKLSKNTKDKHQIILHFDTEQSSYHHHKLATDILKRAAVAKQEYASLPFSSYSLVSTELEDRCRLIDAKLTQLESEGIHIACLVLDGVADIVGDPNDARESNGVVAWLHGLAKYYNCVVLTVLHENPIEPKQKNSGKPRGHLGSQIQRKSETNLSVQKISKDISEIWTERSRGEEIARKDAVKISWCGKKKRHLLHGYDLDTRAPKELIAPTSPEMKLSAKQRRHYEWLKATLAEPVSYTELTNQGKRRWQRKDRSVKGYISQWLENGWIHQRDSDRAYVFGPEPVQPTETGEPKPSNKESKKAEAKKAASKKAASKKAATKKAATKKATKKTVAKKATKKNTPKKSDTKKAAVKKAPTKKKTSKKASKKKAANKKEYRAAAAKKKKNEGVVPTGS